MIVGDQRFGPVGNPAHRRPERARGPAYGGVLAADIGLEAERAADVFGQYMHARGLDAQRLGEPVAQGEGRLRGGEHFEASVAELGQYRARLQRRRRHARHRRAQMHDMRGRRQRLGDFVVRAMAPTIRDIVGRFGP